MHRNFNSAKSDGQCLPGQEQEKGALRKLSKVVCRNVGKIKIPFSPLYAENGINV
jgi:hypothetical protein